MNTRTLRSFLLPMAVAALALTAAACGDDDDADTGDSGGAVTVTDAWAREPAEGQPNAAAYGVITNEGDGDVTLVGASGDVTATYEIHETQMADDGTMSMQEKEDGFVIAPGESLTLEPGGPHVMMLGVDPAEFTDSIEVTFVFDGADPVTTDAEVRSIDGEMGEMDEMDETDDSEMDDSEMDDSDAQSGDG